MSILVFISLSFATIPKPLCDDDGVVDHLGEIFENLKSTGESVSYQLEGFSLAARIAFTECQPMYVLDLSMAQSSFLNNVTVLQSVWDSVGSLRWFSPENDQQMKLFDTTLSRFPDELMCERNRAVFIYGALSRSPVVAVEALCNVTRSAVNPDGLEVRLAFDLMMWLSAFWGSYPIKSFIEGYMQAYLLPTLFLSELSRSLFFSVLHIKSLVPHSRFYCAINRAEYLQVHAAFAAVANASEVALSDLAGIPLAVPKLTQAIARGIKQAERAVILGWLRVTNATDERTEKLMHELPRHHDAIVKAIREGWYD